METCKNDEFHPGLSNSLSLSCVLGVGSFDFNAMSLHMMAEAVLRGITYADYLSSPLTEMSSSALFSIVLAPK